MNQQTHELDPGTPVIIKMGGNPSGGGPICIDSPDTVPFDSPDKRWQGAESTSAGRICELKFNDGELDQICKISSRQQVLASLEVYEVTGGKQLFEIREEPDADGSLRLKIISNIVFQVSEEESEKGWQHSKSEDAFSGNDVKIVFKQRNPSAREDEMSLEYTFSSLEPRVTIFFPKKSD